MKIDAVREAIAALRARQDPVSYRTVLAELGSGSLRDVARLMQQLADEPQAPAALDDLQQLLSPIMPLVRVLTELDVLLACWRYLTQEVPGQLAQWEQHHSTLEQQCAALEAQHEQLDASLADLQAHYTRLKSQVRAEVLTGGN